MGMLLQLSLTVLIAVQINAGVNYDFNTIFQTPPSEQSPHHTYDNFEILERSNFNQPEGHYVHRHHHHHHQQQRPYTNLQPAFANAQVLLRFGERTQNIPYPFYSGYATGANPQVCTCGCLPRPNPIEANQWLIRRRPISTTTIVLLDNTDDDDDESSEQSLIQEPNEELEQVTTPQITENITINMNETETGNHTNDITKIVSESLISEASVRSEEELQEELPKMLLTYPVVKEQEDIRSRRSGGPTETLLDILLPKILDEIKSQGILLLEKQDPPPTLPFYYQFLPAQHLYHSSNNNNRNLRCINCAPYTGELNQ